MTFETPTMGISAAVALLALLAIWFLGDEMAQRRLNRLTGQLASSETRAASASRWRRRIVCGLGVCLAALALARPQLGSRWEPSSARGIDFMIALDVSRSMLAPDMPPSRLERAKLAIRDFVQSAGGDRIGIVAFAGEAFLQCPLTLDHDAVLQTLNACRPESIPVQGTDLGAALAESSAAIGSSDNFRFVVLMTDGEDHGTGLEQAREMADDGLTVYTVGIGSRAGDIIPIKEDEELDYVRDNAGNVVKTSLNPSSLKAIANATGGFYAPLGTTGEGLREVYRDVLSRVPASNRERQAIEVPIERFQWPLAGAVAAFLLTFALGRHGCE